MAHPYHHALSSAKKWGGEPADYMWAHEWFDQTKREHGDFRHRALRHHAEGIFLLEQIFGATFARESDGKVLPVRWLGEQHVLEDLGRIPSASEWVSQIRPLPWMNRSRKLSRELEQAEREVLA